MMFSTNFVEAFRNGVETDKVQRKCRRCYISDDDGRSSSGLPREWCARAPELLMAAMVKCIELAILKR